MTTTPHRQQLFEFGESLCHLMAFDTPDGPLVIATHLEEAPGTSIANASYELASQIQQKLYPDGLPFRLLLHHQPPDPAEDGPLGEAHYCWVRFAERKQTADGWTFSRESYEQLPETAVSQLLGGHLPSELMQLTPTEQQRLIAIRRQREADDREQEAAERASYQVVALDRLPAITDLEDADRAGGADWPVIAAAAIDMFEAGVDPLSSDQVHERSTGYELGSDDRRWLVSLFCDPIVAGPDSARYTNGRHRTTAMRAQGVQRCVVHTNAGYRDSAKTASSPS